MPTRTIVVYKQYWPGSYTVAVYAWKLFWGGEVGSYDLIVFAVNWLCKVVKIRTRDSWVGSTGASPVLSCNPTASHKRKKVCKQCERLFSVTWRLMNPFLVLKSFKWFVIRPSNDLYTKDFVPLKNQLNVVLKQEPEFCQILSKDSLPHLKYSRVLFQIQKSIFELSQIQPQHSSLFS